MAFNFVRLQKQNGGDIVVNIDKLAYIDPIEDKIVYINGDSFYLTERSIMILLNITGGSDV